MSTVLEKTYTPEDLLNLPDAKIYELVDGRLVEREGSVLSSWVGAHIAGILGGFVKKHTLGWLWGSDLGYACFTQSPGKVRRADVSFVRRDRLPEVPTSDGYLYIAPDLAVEVISPNESLYKVDRKLREYLDAGVTLVWVVNPDARTVTIHRAHSVTRLQENEYLDGENVLPGFRCPVASIFPPKELGGLAASTN